jgi:predicted nucleic acid-binding protein
MLLLDTDVLIDVQRGHAPAVDWFSGLDELPSVPGVVVMELIQDSRNAREIRQALKLVAPFPVVWPTESDCERALSDFTTYHLSHSLGLLDSLIAACAIGRSATLCTFNTKHFRPVPGLSLTEPYSRTSQERPS